MSDEADLDCAAAATKDFALFDHTADVGIVAYGRDQASLFVNAARALFSVIVDEATVAERECRTIAVEAGDREALLVSWLNELLFYVDAEQLVFKRFAIDECDATKLRARAFGERVDRDRHDLKTAVKAATYHMLSVEPGTPWRARVILDL